MAIVKITAFRRLTGDVVYYAGCTYGVIKKPTHEGLTPEELLQEVRHLWPRRPAHWRVIFRDDYLSKNGQYLLNGVRIHRSDRFTGPLHPDSYYDWDTAREIWCGYVRMLNRPTKV